jgi:hypothetical protein
MAAAANMADGVRPEDTLYIPKRRRLTHAWLEEPGQPRQLFIYYGTQEICFDEPELLPFGEHLLKVERFRAEDAMAWSGDAPYAWERVKGLFDALVAEGILKRAEGPEGEGARVPKTKLVGGGTPGMTPRTWSARDDECRALTREAVGVSLELGHLEVVFPVYRVAHPALDTDGRQVGEGNAIPRSLFLDLPTERRVCDYPGSRFQDEKLMNVTALKLMMRHWDQTLALAGEMRARFVQRLPHHAIANVGDLHALAVATLSLPGYMMVRGERPVANGELDAGIAVLFRVVDGIRMTTQDMLFGPEEAYVTGDPVTADRVVDHCERRTLFLGLTGVCAGPMKLIREFLELFVDGASVAPRAPSPGLDQIVGEPRVAIDYGLGGLQVESVVQTFVRRKVELARRLFDVTAGPLHAAFEGVPPLSPARSLRNFADVFEQAAALWRPVEPAFQGSLVDALATRPDPARREALAAFLGQTAGAGAPETAAAIVDDFFALERRALRVLDAQQRHLNGLLGRAQPAPLDGAQLEGARREGFDFGRRLAEGLGVAIERGADATALEAGGRRVVLRDQA